MTGGLLLMAVAAVVALVGRAGWRNAGSWAAGVWDDPDEQERKRATLRRGALACWVTAAALAAAGAVSATASVL